jgi:hypothetical protein
VRPKCVIFLSKKSTDISVKMSNGMKMLLETALSVGSENAHSESGTEE